MCSKTTCKSCAKPTWKGCGNHIEDALAGVPKDQRCACDKFAKSAKPLASGGFFARILGK
jgi:hypothetical protein